MTKYFAAQLASVLVYLRKSSVVHRDIKPANLLLNDDWQLKLADFGTARKPIDDTASGSSISYISGLSAITGKTLDSMSFE